MTEILQTAIYTFAGVLILSLYTYALWLSAGHLR